MTRSKNNSIGESNNHYKSYDQNLSSICVEEEEKETKEYEDYQEYLGVSFQKMREMPHL